jgi:uncharacterized membrane protein
MYNFWWIVAGVVAIALVIGVVSFIRFLGNSDNYR